MAKFGTGDLFTFPLPTGGQLSGRIMLDVNRQCVRPKLIAPGSMLSFFGRSLLLEIYAEAVTPPLARRPGLLVPGLFMDSGYLAVGEWEIVGHETVDPATVEFPEALVAQGPHARFVRGEVNLPLALEYEDVRRIGAYRSIVPSSALGDICAFYLGRAADPDAPALPPGDVRSLAGSDLRFSPHRDEVYRALGEDPDEPYDRFAKRHGYDLGRFYR